MLSRIQGPYDQTTAVAPTRYQEHQAGGGYDVELPLALRLQFQYKAPKAEPERGVRFKLDTDQITTLAAREPVETAYYVCPIVDSDNQLSDTLDQCYFVDAQAIWAESSQLYIPRDFPQSGAQGKLKDPDDQSGWTADPSNYYPIPDSAVKTWDEIRTDIEARNIGMIVQDGGRTTQEYDHFVSRLRDLWSLHDDDSSGQVRTDGGEPYDENGEAIDRLVRFATDQFQEFYAEKYPETIDVERHAAYLRRTLEGYRDVRRPDVHGIRRAQELVAQSNQPTTVRRSIQLGSRQ